MASCACHCGCPNLLCTPLLVCSACMSGQHSLRGLEAPPVLNTVSCSGCPGCGGGAREEEAARMMGAEGPAVPLGRGEWTPGYYQVCLSLWNEWSGTYRSA